MEEQQIMIDSKPVEMKHVGKGKREVKDIPSSCTHKSHERELDPMTGPSLRELASSSPCQGAATAVQSQSHTPAEVVEPPFGHD